MTTPSSSFQGSEELDRGLGGKMDETDTYSERWEHFEDMFDDFDLGTVEGVWYESDERRRMQEQLEEALSEGSLFNAEVIEGLKMSLGFFSCRQMEELLRLAENPEEGVAETHSQEKLEKSSKTEVRDQLALDEALDGFEALLQKFFDIVGRFASHHPQDERLKGLINVAWTAIEACALQIQRAARSGKNLTEISLIIFRFDQQLDALDPDHAFVPSERPNDQGPNEDV